MHCIVDMGGTNTRVAFSRDLKDFETVEKYPTPENLKKIRKEIQRHIKSYKKDIKSVIVGIAGRVNRKAKKVIFAPHINEVDGLKIDADFLGIDLPNDKVHLENDATLAGLAESHEEYCNGYNRIAYITLSTGVGGTLIIDKKIPKTSTSYEPGHHIIDIGGDILALKEIEGSWESFSSGTAFKKIYQIDPADTENSYIWQDYGKNLAIGLHNVSLMWLPEIIVLGGSMSKKSELYLSIVKKELEKTLGKNAPEIKISRLDDKNGLLGGLYYLKSMSN